MEGKIVIPATISGFLGFIKFAYATAEQHMTAYGIDPAELAKVKPLLDEFIRLDAVCADPTTASQINREARKKAQRALNTQWRAFLNKEIRLNDAISLTEKAVFGIVPRDDIRTPAEPPKETGKVTVTRKGERAFDAVVEETVTGKKKRPDDATGSNVYSAVTEVNDPAPPRNTFRHEGFSSTSHHKLLFAYEQLGKRAWVYALYSNQHGQEGEEGPLTSFIIS
ncbi:MAG: hypothetical protein LBR86_09010 [Tannerella sp.]|jgi:hypothetical protein|nr:hypothetical protein [Tannerella sp.]